MKYWELNNVGFKTKIGTRIKRPPDRTGRDPADKSGSKKYNNDLYTLEMNRLKSVLIR